MNQCTDFLYHYTSIETLALILSNRTFRLNSLDQIEYSNAIVHDFQKFRAPFSGKIVHIFPEQSAVI